MLLHYLAFFGSWTLGVVILFLMLKNSYKSLKVSDVMITLILSAALSVVFSFAAEKANLFHWFTCICFAGLGGFVTYKFLDKEYQSKRFYAINPMAAIPFLFVLDWGKNGLAFLWVPYALVMAILAITTYRTWYNSTTQFEDIWENGKKVRKWHRNQPRFKLTQIPSFWVMIVLTAIAIGLHFAIQADYK